MKTSDSQKEILLEFMETHGDLCKKSSNARGHDYIQKKWLTLMRKLNSDGSGASRDIGGWRKVWTDLKNNTKKKYSKSNIIRKRISGGGPAAPIIKTKDKRVMAILGEVAATGMAVPEVGFHQNLADDNDDDTPDMVVIEIREDEDEASVEHEDGPAVEQLADGAMIDGYGDWMEESPRVSPTPHIPDTPVWKPPAQKRKLLTSTTRAETASRAFLEAQERDREYERERDRRHEESERERDRMHEELERERIRQRDVELKLQREWLDFMKEAMNNIMSVLEKKRDE